jgi:hypothetical protein
MIQAACGLYFSSGIQHVKESEYEYKPSITQNYGLVGFTSKYCQSMMLLA